MKEIKVEMFALCQGAHDLDGHLTIVNTMDDLIVPELPFRLTFGVAIKLYIQADVVGDKVLSLSIIEKSMGKAIFPPLYTTLHIVKLDKASHVNIALNLQNVLFEKDGVYDVHLELDRVRLDDFAFEIIRK